MDIVEEYNNIFDDSMIKKAITYECLKLLKYWHEMKNYKFQVDHLKFAVSKRKIDCFLYMLQDYDGNREDLSSIYETLIESNDDELIKLMIDYDIPMSKETVEYAVNCGKMNFAVWFINLGTPISDNFLEVSAKNGDIEMIKFALDKGVEYSVGIAISAYNRLNVLKWFYNNGYDIDNDIIVDNAIENGRIDIIKFMDHIGHKFNTKNLLYTIEKNKVDIMMYFIETENVVPEFRQIMENIQYIIKQAVLYNSLNCLEELLEIYPIDEDTLLVLIEEACYSGHFRCLEIILASSEKPIKVDESIYETAKEGGDNDCIELIYEMMTD